MSERTYLNTETVYWAIPADNACSVEVVTPWDGTSPFTERLSAVGNQTGATASFPLSASHRVEPGIAHRYEEFPDNHTAVDYRMDESLPFLVQALCG
jgi:hypothetical protein